VNVYRSLSFAAAFVVAVAAPTRVHAQSAAGNSSNTAVVTTDWVLKTWGANGNGQIADGTTTSRSLPTTPTGISGVTAVAVGGSHVAVAKSDGSVWAWGANSSGQVGDGTTAQRNAPVQISWDELLSLCR
jgi:alpha-tubulin suppressor-like RCC1 family protein